MKKQKQVYRFNIIDAILIVLIIAVAAAILYFVTGDNGIFAKSKNDSKTTVHYVVELKTVDKDYLKNIVVGDEVTETIRSGNVGKIIDIDVEPSWTVTTNTETGEMKKSYYPPINVPQTPETDCTVEVEDSEAADASEENDLEPIGETVTDENLNFPELEYDYYNVRLTIEAEMDYTGTSYTVGGYGIVVGYPIYFRTPTYVGSGYCIAFDVIE